MLSCKEVADRASALIDGELSGWEALRMRLHLAMCKGCSRFIDQIRVTDQLTARVARIEETRPQEAGDRRLADILAMLRDAQQRR